MITRTRRHRFEIGLLAAYALLLSALLPAFASVADPLQAYIGAHLCAPGGSQGGDAPAMPAEHQQKCQLCGPGCSMAGHAPVATLAEDVASVAPRVAAAAPATKRAADILSPLSLYPSDAFSQGPPQAA